MLDHSIHFYNTLRIQKVKVLNVDFCTLKVKVRLVENILSKGQHSLEKLVKNRINSNWCTSRTLLLALKILF